MAVTDFFIVGFMKAGTTALADFLGQHPEVCMSVPKEPAYFATDLMQESDAFHGKPVYFKTRNADDYEQLFVCSEQQRLRGDASTAYIYSRVAAENIYQHNPDARIIILLRRPVEFVHALHRQYLNETVETEADFASALDLEEQRQKGNNMPTRVRVPSYLLYSQRMKFYQQVKRYTDQFPPEQLLILLYDDFRADNHAVYRQVLEFLGLDAGSYAANFRDVHSSREPRVKLLNKFLNYPPLKNTLYKILGGRSYTRLHKSLAPLLMKDSAREELSEAMRRRIEQMTRADVKILGQLLDRDLLTLWGYEH